MNDRYKNTSTGLIGPALDAFAISPDDTTDILEVTRAIYVGGSGDITLVTRGGTQITFANVPAGMLMPIRASRVLTTGTSATDIVGLV